MKLPTLPRPWRDFVVPMYGGRVIAYRDRRRYQSAVRACYGPEDEDMATCRGMCFPAQNEAGARLYVVGWFDGELPTLVHECGHLAVFVLGHAGIDPKDSAGEPLCYVLDYVFAAIYSGKHTP